MIYHIIYDTLVVKAYKYLSHYSSRYQFSAVKTTVRLSKVKPIVIKILDKLNMQSNLSIESIHNEELIVLQLDAYSRIPLVCILCILLCILIVIKGGIINYIRKYSPRNRPVNSLILIDQVYRNS